MSAAALQALAAARAAGVRLRCDGDTLILEGEAAPPVAVLDALAHHKPEVTRLLRLTAAWAVFFSERAAVAEYDGGLSRPEAEAVAFAACLDWLGAASPTADASPSASPQCAWCGGSARPDDPIGYVMFGAGGGAHLHRACERPWADQVLRVEAARSANQKSKR